jgi:hypothetical protein
VTTPTHVLSVTAADVDYLALADVWCLELAGRRVFHKAWGAPLGVGVSLPDQVGGASIDVRRRRFRVALLEEEGATRIVVDAPPRFACDIRLARPRDHESLSVVIPWSDRRFQCTTKDNTRPAAGTIMWDGEVIEVVAGASWGCLDYGRGKWPYRTAWNWGSASGTAGERGGEQIGEHTVGLQLGGKWTVGTGFTENALCVDGRLTKLSEELAWDYDTDDWMRPWRISSPGRERVDLTFTPVYDKPSRMELGVASSTVHQCFGTYAGTIVPDTGGPIEVDGLFGWAEEARWRW